jgi:hypothetical protein
VQMEVSFYDIKKKEKGINEKGCTSTVLVILTPLRGSRESRSRWAI